MLARLLVQPLARLEHVAARSPGVGGGPRHVPFAHVRRRGPTVTRRELQLLRGPLVELRRGIEGVGAVAQFQTLTSR
jgi:hypothetical protein